MGHLWRSLLFLPADNIRHLERVHERGADAIILDLEDSVPADAKSRARELLGPAATRLSGLGQDVVVRINAAWLPAFADLTAAVAPGVSAVMVPKLEDSGRLKALSEIVGEMEAERGLPVGRIKLIALIESPIGLERLPEIARVERLEALALGPEDFALNLGVRPGPENLDLPCRMLANTAAAHGLAAIGAPISVASFDDPEAYGAAAARGRAMGLTGALCIHPAQVQPVNEAFAPSADELEEARAIQEAWAQAGERGVVKLGKKMIDEPVAAAAQRVLVRAGHGRNSR